jgi:hypothetical protein
MLSQQSLEISANFSKSLLDKKISLEPLSGTALSELSAAVNNVYNPSYQAKTVEDIVHNLFSASEGTYLNSKTGKTYAISSHDAFIDDYTAKLSKLVAGYVRFARAVVLEEVKSLNSRLTSDLENYKFKEPEDFFAVTYFKPADIFSSALIDSEVSAYKTASGYVVDYIGTGRLTSDTLKVGEYLLTGNPEIDVMISTWIASVGEGQIFSYITTDIKEYMMDVPDILNYSLANYLFYRNLAERTDLDLGHSLMQLRTKTANNRAAFGYKLFAGLETYAKTIRNKQLMARNTNPKLVVQPFSTATFAITLYEESFKALSEAECPIEAVFGSVAYDVDNYAITTDEIIAKKDFYLNKWENVRSLYIIRLNNSRLDLFKNMLSSAFLNNLSTGNEEELAARKGFTNYMAVVNEKFTAYVATITTDQVDDLSKICLEVVANIRFYYSNAYSILSNMEKMLAMHSSMKPDEAALYSVVDYLVDFFTKQMTISKH